MSIRVQKTKKEKKSNYVGICASLFPVPVSPIGIQGMTYNTTAVSIWLDMWNDGGCSILYFIIEYRRESDSEWKVSTKPVPPSDRIYVISDLLPGIRYQMRITAHNNIGSTVQIYNFTTFNEEGGTHTCKFYLIVFLEHLTKIMKTFDTILYRNCNTNGIHNLYLRHTE